MAVIVPQCDECRHLKRNIAEYSYGYKCKAFPDGIPYEITSGQHDHNKPFPGDNGIGFEFPKASKP
tara:strand:- start:904 stop:1101 length:198 start_codon:yes stop_codon:yes gene_type:complete